METINRLLEDINSAPNRGQIAYSLGHLCASAELDRVILPDDFLEQVATSSDLNDAVGMYAVFLQRRIEANGGSGFKRDW